MLPNRPLPSVMKHDFSRVPNAEIPRSSFKRSHGVKTAFDSAYLVPILVDEAYPGDTFKVSLSSVARLATPIYPIMDNIWLDFFFFAVPFRLIWNSFQKFMGEQTDPGDSTDYTVPQIVAPAVTGWTEGSLSDYFGLPTGVADLSVAAFWHRAYNFCYNEFFRDQNLQDSVVVDKDDGPDSSTDYVLLKRGKRHDYFTSALPWPQKGTEVDMPLGSEAPVIGLGKENGNFASGPNTFLQPDGVVHTFTNYAPIDFDFVNSKFYVQGSAASGGQIDLYADLASATAATINSLREAFQLQKMMEKEARGGTRYTEIVRSHFGVTSPDARLQRPEYLGGGTTAMGITPIPQTSESGTTKQGTLAAVGYASQSGVGFTKSFVEHSVILGLVSVRADLTYQQGLNRMWSRSTKYDFYFPSLAHLGEQELLNKEIYCDGSANDDLVFGYQERFAELRYKPSLVTGAMRSSAAAPLDAWHLAQDFASLPALNADFIVEAPPISRVVATPADPEIIFDGYFDMTCTRPLPMYSVPGLIDHF